MLTVFDHNLTPEEIEAGGFLDNWLTVRHGLDFPNPITPEGYRSTITPEAALFDLVLLFELRGELSLANNYAALIPERVAEYRRGFDYEIKPV